VSPLPCHLHLKDRVRSPTMEHDESYDVDYRDSDTVWVTMYDLHMEKLVTVELTRDLLKGLLEEMDNQ